ncbi:hypothetical protein KEM54_006983 [Ascosphaera aggregata]|nr:hypothetical protein KEM54_006983 [Ascosphaera aggregata]
MTAPVSESCSLRKEFPFFQDVKEYYLKHDKEGVFKKLDDLCNECWQDPKGDLWFQDRRKSADEATVQERFRFFHMMMEIGDELEAKHHVFSQLHRERSTLGQNVKILDLCMAPGGYTASALKHLPFAKVCGITLDPELGGHPVLLREGAATMEYLDLTMLIRELMAPCGEFTDDPAITTTSTPTLTTTVQDDMSTTPELDPSLPLPTVPADHPDAKNFNSARPFMNTVFNLIFCDGQVLRTHPRQSYREKVEARRLLISQAIIALQRLPPSPPVGAAAADDGGGTMVVLLHKLENPYTVQFIYMFSRFADIELFKPQRKHAIRSSLYLIAKNIRPRSPEALEALKYWKRVWWNATFEAGEMTILEMGENVGGKDCFPLSAVTDANESVEMGLAPSPIQKQREEVLRTLDIFGEKLIELARPLWLIQIEALQKKRNDGFRLPTRNCERDNRDQG